MAQEFSDRSFTVPAMLSEDSFTSSGSAFAPYAGTKGAAPVVGDTLLVYHVVLFAVKTFKLIWRSIVSLIVLAISTCFACIWQLQPKGRALSVDAVVLPQAKSSAVQHNLDFCLLRGAGATAGTDASPRGTGT